MVNKMTDWEKYKCVTLNKVVYCRQITDADFKKKQKAFDKIIAGYQTGDWIVIGLESPPNDRHICEQEEFDLYYRRYDG